MASKLTKEEFVSKARSIHGDKYDYSLVDYVNSQTKVSILCPIHGIFDMKPNSHLSGQGCWECGLELRANNRVNNAKLKFKERASHIHNNKYNYELVEYTGTRNKIDIICPIHGVYSQIANEHLRGKGCIKCYRDSQFSDTESFIASSKLVHGDTYDYSEVKYINNKTKVTIICPVHGSYMTSPSIHLKGSDCPLCANQLNIGWSRTGFIQKCIKNNSGLGILYILECFNDKEKFFKIGITSRSIKERYKSKSEMPYAYSVIKEIVGDAAYIYDLETKLHNLNKEYKYIPLIPFDGHLTECFNFKGDTHGFNF